MLPTAIGTCAEDERSRLIRFFLDQRNQQQHVQCITMCHRACPQQFVFLVVVLVNGCIMGWPVLLMRIARTQFWQFLPIIMTGRLVFGKTVRCRLFSISISSLVSPLLELGPGVDGKKCLDWQNGMRHFVIVEAFHGSSRVTKLFALSAGASSSLMKVITQVKLLVTGLLNRMVGRVVTLTQWMLIAAVTVLVFSFIQCSAEVDGARKAMALAKDANRNELWLGYLPPA